MMQKAHVYNGDILAGELQKTDDGQYIFSYDANYLQDNTQPPISLSLPKKSEPFVSDGLFAFFYGLLSEGSLKAYQCRTLKIDENDDFTRLLGTCHTDTAGSVTVREVIDE